MDNLIVNCYLIANGQIHNVNLNNVWIIRIMIKYYYKKGTKDNILAYILQVANGIGINVDKLLVLISMLPHKGHVLKHIVNGLIHLNHVVISIVHK